MSQATELLKAKTVAHPLTREGWSLVAILLGGLLLRLFRLDLPILEFYYSRQVQTAEVTRNLWRNGYNLLYPQAFWQGNIPVHFAPEFPLYNAVVALLYGLIGDVNEALGRLISLAFWLGATWLLYLLVKQWYGHTPALFAAAFFTLSPLGILTSRAFQPDATALFFSLAAFYFFSQGLETERTSPFLLAGASLGLAILVKLPMLHLLLPLLFLAALKYRWRAALPGKLWLTPALCFIPAGLWYAHSAQTGQAVTQGYFAAHWNLSNWFQPQNLADPRWYQALLQIELDWVLTPLGLVLLVLGLFLRPREPRELVFYVWGLSVGLYLLFFNVHATTHFYYHLPFVPVAAVFVGRALAFLMELGLFRQTLLSRKLFLVLALAIMGLWAIRPVSHAYRLPAQNQHVLEAAAAVRELTPPEALVVASSGSSPQLLYYSDRKGWAFLVHQGVLAEAGLVPRSEADPVVHIEKLRRQGAQYFATGNVEEFTSHEAFSQYMRSHYPIVRETPTHIVFDLRQPFQRKGQPRPQP